jgi:outer membrane protein
VLVLVLVLAAPLAFAQAGAEQLTVDQAVLIAIQESEGVRAVRERHLASEDQADSARGRLLPTLSVSDSQYWFKSPLNIGLPPTAPGGQATTLSFKDLNANLFTAGASQPLLGLFHLSESLASANSSADASQFAVRVAESGIREAVRTGFLRLFQGKAQEDIARASQVQLKDQLTVAQAKYDAGVLTTADLLRIKVAAANARQQEIQANVQERTTRSNLLVLLGRDPNDRGTTFLEPTALEDAPLPATLTTSVAAGTAISHRAEVAQADAQAGSAKHEQWARLFELLPELSLQASYIRAGTAVAGEKFPAIQAEYIGFAANWPFWQWGTTYYAHRAAAHEATAARLFSEQQRREVSVDATNKLETAQAAAAAVEVANTAIASAEEAFRVTQAMVKAGSATTTDLLDSQSALTQAKLNLVRAKYEQAVALVALDRATGD